MLVLRVLCGYCFLFVWCVWCFMVCVEGCFVGFGGVLFGWVGTLAIPVLADGFGIVR